MRNSGVMTPYDLNLRHLLAVREIARLGGVSHASAAIHLSQPALTQALVKLERGLGQRLFDRRPNGMTPTAAGLDLVDRVNRAVRELTAGFDALPGVGPVTAAAIVAWRQAHGKFTSVDQLADVEGIGPARLDKLRALVRV